MENVHSRFVMAGGIRTHYLEAGDGPPVVLLHSGEFGACAELTWEFNIPALARHFRVVAPDWLGFGETEKLFSFEDMYAKRIWHIRQFLDALCIGRADFIGNSMGGTMLVTEASRDHPPWDMRRIVVVSGGGHIPLNAARDVLNTYDGTREHMRRVLEVLLMNPRIATDPAYIDRRHRLSLMQGSWECTAGVRFKAPWRMAAESGGRPIQYANIQVPVLVVAGRRDTLREPNYADTFVPQIPHGRLHMVEAAGHCPQIDEPEEFNRVASDYLLAPDEAIRRAA